MLIASVLLVTLSNPFAQFILADPTGSVPVLPAGATPRIAGGWLPNPPPPSKEYVLSASAAAGRPPGGFVVYRKVDSATIGDARVYPGVGKGRLWRVTYRCEVNGPAGLYTVYVDRAAIVRAP